MADTADRGTRVIQPGTVNAPEFPSGLEWLNTETPLSIKELRGKIVLLDFWTYCCINCMHVLEDLKRLERKYREELVVIGVHSAKFDAEKHTDRIREAILRYGIDHPVVNDAEMRVWQEYAVRAWPSFILIDPLGKVFGTHSGEQVFDLFDKVISQMVRHYEAGGELCRGPLQNASEASRVPDSLLSFPGKVLADEGGGRLFIADSNHHRIVVASLADGTVRQVIGGCEPGFADGTAETARFCQPQGMALSADRLYIADTGNHAVRVVDLDKPAVSTLAGDGQQDTEWNSRPGPLDSRRLNSPWDLQMAHGVLFVAMAGNHQIFGIDLDGGYIASHAGSGREDHVDGPLMAAALAQPSGLTSDGESLFVADSEISSIRAVSLDPRGGHVRTVVGKGLFDFGDVDGVGQEVRLQHPLGVAYADGKLFVADTYNNKIKSITLPALDTKAVAGTGEAGCRDGAASEARFNQPGGLSYAAGNLYVADTNSHAIRKVDARSGAVSPWPLREVARLAPQRRALRTLPERSVKPGIVTVRVDAELPAGRVLAHEASSGVTVRAGERAFPAVFRDGIAETSIEIIQDEILHVEAILYYCSAGRSGACYCHNATQVVPLRTDQGGPSEVALAFAVSA
ncbi:MAG: thioredoxin-like domain-containing protein [Bryobacterales bacterium]|nr:thioredoxin-like domain-containing protein [Bryobacterales bacterium]